MDYFLPNCNIMKKLMGSLLMLLIIGGMSSCRSDLDPMEAGNYRSQKTEKNPVLKTIRMAFGGDCITESEEPLLRAEDGEQFSAINVFRTEKDKADAQEEKYAYGLFKGKGDITIDLLTGYNYRFEASILIEKEDKLFVNNKNHPQPFQVNTEQNATGSNKSYNADNLGKFQYTSLDYAGKFVEDRNREYFTQLKSGTAYIDTGTGGDLPSRYGPAWYPRVKRYYGTVDTFDPGLYDTVEIWMAYKCFGLRFEVYNLPAGTLTVKDVTKLDAIRDKQPEQLLIFPKNLELSKENKEWEGVFSMNNLLGESETITLEFTWHKGGNTTEKFTAEVTVKPKTKKVLRLNVNGSTNYETKGNIIFTMDSEEMGNEVQELSLEKS